MKYIHRLIINSIALTLSLNLDSAWDKLYICALHGCLLINLLIATELIWLKDGKRFVWHDCDSLAIKLLSTEKGRSLNVQIPNRHKIIYTYGWHYFFFISYLTWVFIQMLSSVLPWSPGPECTEQFDCRDGFSLLICSEHHISKGGSYSDFNQHLRID